MGKMREQERKKTIYKARKQTECDAINNRQASIIRFPLKLMCTISSQNTHQISLIIVLAVYCCSTLH